MDDAELDKRLRSFGKSHGARKRKKGRTSRGGASLESFVSSIDKQLSSHFKRKR